MLDYYKDNKLSCNLSIFLKYNVNNEDFLKIIKKLEENIKKLLNRDSGIHKCIKNNQLTNNYDLKLEDVFYESDNLVIDLINDYKILDNKGIVYIINKKKKVIYTIFNHVIYDGTRVSNELLLDIIPYYSKKTSYKVTEPDYYLFYCEFMCLYKCVEFLFYKKRTLEISKLLIKVTNKNISRNLYNLNELQKLKGNKNIKTLSILISFYVYKIFKYSKKKIDSLNIGIIGAFKNKRFLNNYSVVVITIRNNNLNEIIKEVDKKFKQNYNNFLHNYHMNSTLGFINPEKMTKNIVDILFSGVYFFGDYESKNIEVYVQLQSISFPIYVSCVGDKEKVTYSSHIMTDDVDINKFKQEESYKDYNL